MKKSLFYLFESYILIQPLLMNWLKDIFEKGNIAVIVIVAIAVLNTFIIIFGFFALKRQLRF